MVDINYTLNIGAMYLYEEDDNEIPIDMRIYQNCKMNMKLTSNSKILFSFDPDFRLIYGLQGTLSNFESETMIEINCLANSYSILLKAINSYNFFLSIENDFSLKENEFEIPFPFLNKFNESYISNNVEIINFYKEYSFRDPFLDTNIFTKLSLFSSYDIDLQSLSLY